MSLSSGLSGVALAAVLLAARPAAAAPTKVQCIAANEDGQDLRRAGKLREAVERLAQCTDPSCPGPVREDCARRLEETKRAIPTVAFAIRNAQGAKIAGARVTIDGVPASAQEDGAIATSPGEHSFEIGAHGYRTTSKKLMLAEGARERQQVVLVEISTPAGNEARTATPPEAGDRRDPAGEPPVDAGRSAAPERGASAPPALSETGSLQRRIAYALAGTGVVGIAIGVGFGVAATRDYNDAVVACGGNPQACKSADAKRDGDDAHGQLGVSTIGYVLGGALLAGGVLLYLTAPRDTGVRVAFGARGVALVGTWR